ncbi:nacht and ankyrin domain protein, partial [Colletotrichum musicola]
MDGKRFIDGLRGLLAVADASFRLVFHFANAIEPSDRDPDLRERIMSLADEIQQLSGLLHRMALLATGLERDGTERWFGEPMLPVSLPSRLIACHQTLAKLEKSLQRRDVGAELKKKENGHCDPFLELRWPFTRAWTLDLIQELEGHKTAVADAVGSIRPGHSLENLWKEFMEKKDYRGRSAEMYRLTRYHGLKEPNDFAAANFFTMGFDYYVPLERHLKARNPASRFSFLEGEEFEKWATGAGQRLWMTGAAGTGKSVLAASVVDEVMRMGRRDVAVAFHFIEFSDLRTHEPQAFLGSLVVQLAARNEEARGMLDKYQKELQPEKGKAGRRPTIDRLMGLLATMAGLFHHVLVIVDGVDEARDEAEAVVRVLASLAVEKLSIAMVSRDEERICEIVRDEFKRVEIHTPHEEIRLFTAGELQKKLSSGKLFLPDSRAVDEAVRKISSQPNTTFLQASANVEFLCVLETPTQQENFLNDLPTSLNNTYQLFLHRFNRAPSASKALVQATLQLASITDGPLASVELCQALSVSGIPGLDPDSLAHPEVDESEFMTLCGFFLNKSDGGNRVSLASTSLKEFLERIDPSDPEFAGYHVSKASANRTLGLCALRFLSLEHFSRLPARSNSEEAFIVKRDARYPFYRYAALCWPHLSENLWDDPEFVEEATALCGSVQTPSFKAWCLEVCRFYQFHGSYNAR